MRQPDDLDQHKCAALAVGRVRKRQVGYACKHEYAAPHPNLAPLCSISMGQSGRFSRPVLRGNALHHRERSEFGNWRSTLRAHIVACAKYMQILQICCAPVAAMKSPCFKNCPCCCGSSHPQHHKAPSGVCQTGPLLWLIRRFVGVRVTRSNCGSCRRHQQIGWRRSHC